MGETTLFDRRDARRSDPSTSKGAPRICRNRAAEIVSEVMRDGFTRIDEEIHAAAVAAGHQISADRIRHGRLDLVAEGSIVQDGFGQTSSGSRSRRWRWSA